MGVGGDRARCRGRDRARARNRVRRRCNRDRRGGQPTRRAARAPPRPRACRGGSDGRVRSVRPRPRGGWVLRARRRRRRRRRGRWRRRRRTPSWKRRRLFFVGPHARRGARGLRCVGRRGARRLASVPGNRDTSRRPALCRHGAVGAGEGAAAAPRVDSPCTFLCFIRPVDRCAISRQPIWSVSNNYSSRSLSLRLSRPDAERLSYMSCAVPVR